MLKINPNWQYREIFPNISAYTYVYNAEKNGYPYIDAIKSFSWADEVVVVNANHEPDGTEEKLEELEKEMSNLQVHEVPLDLDDPGKDGQQKALARAMCTSEYLVQFDADELCKGNPEKWKKLCKNFSENVDILNLFVAEPIGKRNRLKYTDQHNPSKWRIYRNQTEITHGIPKHDRLEKDGKVYSKGGSDGCFPVHIVNYEMYPSKDHETVKNIKKLYRKDKEEYKKAVSELVQSDEPWILHLGHEDVMKKIKLYLNEWHWFWCELYALGPDDPQNNSFFPDKLPSEVTKQGIQDKVKEIEENTEFVEVDNVF